MKIQVNKNISQTFKNVTESNVGQFNIETVNYFRLGVFMVLDCFPLKLKNLNYYFTELEKNNNKFKETNKNYKEKRFATLNTILSGI